MPVIFIYLLKIIVCSGVLLGYYWLALRNKIYHGYNRFYLLASVIISLIVPFIEFHFTHSSADTVAGAIKVLQVVGSGTEYLDEVIVTAKTKQLSGIELAGFTYMLISLVFISVLLNGLLRIRTLYKKNQRKELSNICIIDTTAKDTPFSFFKYIFWNSQIDINSETGMQIFKHEMVHVNEKHSIDKVFINLVLAILWCNPFFWLVKRELNMIHEFIADRKSLEKGDTATFALMILQTSYPQQNFSITNQFFYSPIKRRLAMITKNKNSKASYIARLLALPLFVLIVSAFSVKTKVFNKVSLPGYAGDAITVVIDAGHGGNDWGASSKDGKIFEKDLALAIAKKINELNTNEKINIILSRTDDSYASPQEKVAFAKKKNADCFVSIHVAAVASGEIQNSGLGVWVAKDQYPIATKSKVLASAIISEFSGNYPLPVASNPLQRDKGIWAIQAEEYPSVLIEPGFIDNKKDLAFLQSEEGQRSIAINILAALEKYAANKNQPTASAKPDTIPGNLNFRVNKLTIQSEGSTTSTAEGNVSIGGTGKMLIIADGKKVDQANLRNTTINAKTAMVYGASNKEAIEKFGQDASDGAIVLTEVKIVNNESSKNETILNIEEATIVGIDNPASIVKRSEIVDASQKNPVIKKDEWGKTVIVKETALPGKSLNGKVTITRTDTSTKSQPLYVVNGVVKDDDVLKQINPENIESITVLKDEAATVIYGPKAKNGVILITTKKNVLNEVVAVGYTDNKSEPVFNEVEKEASVIGGEQEWSKYLMSHIDGSIPVKEGWKKGKYQIVVQFKVSKTGEISDVKTINYEGSKTAEHCINLVSNGPKWSAAIQNGHAVNSYKKQPITFIVE